MVTTVQDYRTTRNGSPVARWSVDFATGDITTGGTDSGVLELEGYDEVTLYFKYTGDTASTVQVFDAPNVGFGRGNQHQLGNDISLSDGSGTTQFDRETISQHAAFVRLNVSADSVNATSGTLEVDVLAVGV